MQFKIIKPVFHPQNAIAEFSYCLGDHHFRETLTFAPDFNPAIPQSAEFLATLNLTAVILGVSYFKLRAPFDISFSGFNLHPAQHELVLDVYENGLGEFYARNSLNRFGKINFISEKNMAPDFTQVQQAQPSQAEVENKPRHLLLIGGGKDSLVSAQLLEKAHHDFTPFAVNPKGPINASIQAIGKTPLFVKRVLDPEMIRLGQCPGYYNGHVPSTAINSMIGALSAQLFNYNQIVLSNERSASEATTRYDGRNVNHQHSKSYEFEKLLHTNLAYISNNKLNYFSLLRPFSELKIVRIFARSNRFDALFSSCNSNFLQGENQQILWCNNCPKCHFVYLIFAPFMPPERLNKIFGTNPLNNVQNTSSLRSLCGLGALGDHKPWECVGETLEAASALFALTQTEAFKSTIIVRKLSQELAKQYGTKKLIAAWAELMKDSNQHLVPRHLHPCISFVESEN